MTAFRVFSGWDSRQAEAAEVFAYSVRENASIPVEVIPLKLEALPINRQATTQFTYTRWLVPWWCDYEGVALFCDGADQLCLGDVAELAAIDMTDYAVRVVKHKVVAQPRPRIWSSVMLMDCAKLGWMTPGYVETTADDRLMRFHELGHRSIGDLPSEWNTLVSPGKDPPEGTKLAHWTELANPNGGAWIDRGGSRLWREWRLRWLNSKPPGPYEVYRATPDG